MAAEKVTVTFDSLLLELIRESAGGSGQTVSGWLASAARNRLRELGAVEMARWLNSGEGREVAEVARKAGRRAVDKVERRSSAA